MPLGRSRSRKGRAAGAGPSTPRGETTPRKSRKSHDRKSGNNKTNNSKPRISIPSTTPPTTTLPSTSPLTTVSPPTTATNPSTDLARATSGLTAAAALSSALTNRGTSTLNVGDTEESTEWLSHILEEMWPYASSIAETVFKGFIEPALIANMPAIFPALRFTNIHLGANPPRVNGVTVVRGGAGGENRPDLVAVEADLSFEGDPHIEMSVGPPPATIKCGVTNAYLRGRVELLVRPLLKRLPLVGATQFAFVNPPTIEYDLTGAARWADIDLFRKTFRRVTNQVIAALCVLPNRVTFTLDPHIDFLSFVAQPIGVLRVCVLRGEGFPNTDDNALLWRKHLAAPDVYVTLQHGAVVKTTHRVDDDSNPVYHNQCFDFVLTSTSKHQTVLVHAYDYDMGKQDELLGFAHVKVSDLIANNKCVVRLQGAPHDATPTLTLMGRWLPLSSDLARVQTAILTQRAEPSRPPQCSRLLLTINISEACNLPESARPFVRATVGKEVKFETWTAFKTSEDEDIAPAARSSLENPKFEVSFHALLGEPISSESRVDFAVIDQRTGRTLGTAFALLSDFVFRKPHKGAYVFALLNCSRPDSSLRASIKLDAVLDTPPLWTVAQDEYEKFTNENINTTATH